MEQPVREDDLYANIAFSPGWATEFLVSVRKFHVEYLTMEALSEWGAKEETVPGVTHWTSVIELEPEKAGTYDGASNRESGRAHRSEPQPL